MKLTPPAPHARTPAWQDLPAPQVELRDLLLAPHRSSPADPDGVPGVSRPNAPTTREEELQDLLDRVRLSALPDDRVAATAARSIEALATPPGALGRLGELAVQLAGIAGRSPAPVPVRPAVIVAAGDHGVHAQHVSPWPQTVSAAVAGLLAEGRAGASAIATANGVRTVVLDVGLATDPDRHPRLLHGRVVSGTRDASHTDALTAVEVASAVLIGARVATALVVEGCDLLAIGDVGIGNTTTSAGLIAALTGADPATVTGRGSGVDDDTLAHKARVVQQVVRRAATRDPLALLAAVGGAEHAALVGVLLAATVARTPVLLDGVVTDAAALVATRLAPAVAGAILAGHRSPEPAATVALQALGAQPLLDLDLRLGEGSGALLAVPTVVAAARLLHDVARRDEVVG